MIFALADKRIVKILFAATVISFLWLGTFGLVRHMSEMRPNSASGSGCLFNERAETCTMNFSEHIALWVGMVTTLPQDVVALSLLVLALSLVVVTASWQDNLFEFSKQVASRWGSRIKQNPQVHLFNFLIEEFSRGILNSKIFASATI